MIVATNVAFVLLAAGAVLAGVRLVRGPSIADRVVATDLLLTDLVIGVGVFSARTGRDQYLDVMLIVAIVGFVGTMAVARFIERRGV